MNKILVISAVLISSLSFSNSCKWVSNASKHEKKMIQVIKKERLDKKVYCDNDNEYMIYSTITGSENIEMQIGLIYNKVEKRPFTYGTMFELFEKFTEDLEKIQPKNLTPLEQLRSPVRYNYRMYLYNPETKEVVMPFKYVLDMRTNGNPWQGYYINIFNGENEEERRILKLLDSWNLKPTEDVLY